MRNQAYFKCVLQDSVFWKKSGRNLTLSLDGKAVCKADVLLQQGNPQAIGLHTPNSEYKSSPCKEGKWEDAFPSKERNKRRTNFISVSHY